jgi:serine/threonine-protein phosphatase PGAM5
LANRIVYLARHGHAGADGALSDLGRQQADLLGQRLRDVPLAAVHHSPVPRAAQTAELVSRHLPGIGCHAAELVGDYPPPVGPEELPPGYASIIGTFSAAERDRGATLAAAAIERFARPPQDADEDADADAHELIVTHNFLIGWFVRHALGAPDWRWLGLNQCNGALTAIRYSTGWMPSVLTFNDMCHLPPELRWTGFPPDLRL